MQEQGQKPSLQQMLSMFKGDPETIANQLYQTNPQFKQFVNDNKNLSLEQLAQKFNIPLK